MSTPADHKKTALVISAHAADFVWRAGGVIALHQQMGYREEAKAAATALGVSDIRFLDLGDYPLRLDHDAQDQMVDIIREVQPKWMSHSCWGPYNTDHMNMTQFVLECRMIAQAWGHKGTEFLMWMMARGALGKKAKLLTENYHIPISNTGAGTMLMECVDD